MVVPSSCNRDDVTKSMIRYIRTIIEQMEAVKLDTRCKVGHVLTCMLKMTFIVSVKPN